MGRSIHHPVGLIYGTLGESYAGYTLITNNGGDHATLLDMEGRICHRWQNDEGIGYAYLLPNGNLLCRTSKVTDVELVNGLGGSSKALLELDWDGNVVWEYRNDMLHHDFERLPNGFPLSDTGSRISLDRRAKAGWHQRRIGASHQSPHLILHLWQKAGSHLTFPYMDGNIGPYS